MLNLTQYTGSIRRQDEQTHMQNCNARVFTVPKPIFERPESKFLTENTPVLYR